MGELGRAEPLFFHVDMDAFYATLEQARNPEYQGKAVMVGGSSDRGVVTTCSYEARKFGVRSGMPYFKAKKLCPDGIFLPIDMEFYKEASTTIMEILATFTTTLQQVSIDEAFLEMSGTSRYIGEPEDIARSIQERVEESMGITLSIGIASSKYVAKIASDMRKPRGIYRVLPGKEETFMLGQPLKHIWGLGPKGRELLAQHHITTIPQLHSYSEDQLHEIVGERLGTFLYRACRGIDPGAFRTERKSQSISNETTFQRDVSSLETLDKTLLQLSQKVMFRVLDAGATPKGVGIKVVLYNKKSWTSTRVGAYRTSSTKQLFIQVKELLREKWDGESPIRLIGVSVEVEPRGQRTHQLELFEDDSTGDDEREQSLDRVVLQLKKQGVNLTRAKLLSSKKKEP